MPTGYTDLIDRNPKLSTEKWIMEGLVRAFGVTVTLREEAFDLNEEQIKQKIADDSRIKYHQKALGKAIADKLEFERRTDSQWEEAWRESEKEKEKQNRRSISRAKKMTKRHNQVAHDLRLIGNSDVSTFTKSVIKFGLEQLNLVAHECDPYITEPIGLSKFKRDMLNSNIRDIKHHTKELSEAKRRIKERLEAYATLKKDVASVLSAAREESAKGGLIEK